MSKFHIGYINAAGKLETYLTDADSHARAYDMAALQHGAALRWVRKAI